MRIDEIHYHRHNKFHIIITISLIYILMIGIFANVLTKRYLNSKDISSQKRLFFRYFILFFFVILISIYLLGLLFNWLTDVNVFSSVFKGSSNLVQGFFNLIGTTFAVLVV
jgi:hypothetical protein